MLFICIGGVWYKDFLFFLSSFLGFLFVVVKKWK